jgi:hypothetical protein
MTYRGEYRNGVIVLSGKRKLAEGTVVRVEPIGSQGPSRVPSRSGSALGKRLLRFAGTAEGLPGDLARNHDHYVHGTRRK